MNKEKYIINQTPCTNVLLEKKVSLKFFSLCFSLIRSLIIHKSSLFSSFSSCWVLVSSWLPESSLFDDCSSF